MVMPITAMINPTVSTTATIIDLTMFILLFPYVLILRIIACAILYTRTHITSQEWHHASHARGQLYPSGMLSNIASTLAGIMASFLETQSTAAS